MLNAFIGQVSEATGLAEGEAKAAIGIVLNASERQRAPLANEIFERVPGAVPYTQLTLPTKREVYVSLLARS